MAQRDLITNDKGQNKGKGVEEGMEDDKERDMRVRRECGALCDLGVTKA